MANTRLPARPFDGQVFIDSARVVWTFNAENDAWMRTGTEPNIPVATEFQPGLLSAALKNLLDGIPAKGGGFGILAKPLLSVVPLNHAALLKDSVKNAYTTEAGSTIVSKSALTKAAFQQNIWSGKLLHFTSGFLKDKNFLIAANTDTDIKLLGNAGKAKIDDRFEIIEPTALNLSGIIAGNIELVSESIDITCVDQNDETISTAAECATANQLTSDATQGPGIDFKVSDLFKTQFCAQQPGCPGPRGVKGPTGAPGKDGTGDGPQGETGVPGQDAPQTPLVLDGIRIIDVDDIFDTAVVGLEIDAVNSKLNVVKAKIRTPDSSTPATQLIATEVFRGLDFTGDGFNFNIQMPPGDPIGTPDIDLVVYPDGFTVPTTTGGNKPTTTTVQTLKFNDFMNEVGKFWQDQLDIASTAYNKQIEAFINGKDEAARTILSTLCQELTECEWNKPFEYCMGIQPSDCNPALNGGGANPPPVKPPPGGGGGGGGGSVPPKPPPNVFQNFNINPQNPPPGIFGGPPPPQPPNPPAGGGPNVPDGKPDVPSVNGPPLGNPGAGNVSPNPPPDLGGEGGTPLNPASGSLASGGLVPPPDPNDFGD